MEHTQVAIIGSGPAGYTAAVYTARAQLAPIVLTGQKAGGQLMWTTDVENYPGFPKGIPGPQLMMDMRAQAERFGAVMKDTYVTAVDFSARPFKIWTAVPEGVNSEDLISNMKPDEAAAMVEKIKSTLEPAYEADSVILAPGATSIMLGIPGEQEFFGRGVSTCAVCDAAFYRDKITYVVGGGDSAMEDTLALTKFAKKVTVVHRRDQFRASKIMQDRVLSNEKVSVLWNSSVEEVKGDTMVSELVLKTPEGTQTVPADGIFIAIGHRPMTKLFADSIETDDHGYIVTRESATKKGVAAAQQALSAEGLVAFPTMTSVDGVFAAGDSVDVRYKQAITAAGMGCSAALDAERWLEAQE